MNREIELLRKIRTQLVSYVNEIDDVLKLDECPNLDKKVVIIDKDSERYGQQGVVIAESKSDEPNQMVLFDTVNTIEAFYSQQIETIDNYHKGKTVTYDGIEAEILEKSKYNGNQYFIMFKHNNKVKLVHKNKLK